MKDYKKQALDFCEKTKTTITVNLAKEQKKPSWADENDGERLHYIVKMENPRGGLTIDYWGSIADHEKVEKAKNKTYNYSFQNSKNVQNALEEVKPDAYSVLACLTIFDGTFKDFCDEFGYSTDSIKAQETYFEVRRQTGRLLDMYTHKELEELQEIW